MAFRRKNVRPTYVKVIKEEISGKLHKIVFFSIEKLGSKSRAETGKLFHIQIKPV
jgi:hypothetical protein